MNQSISIIIPAYNEAERLKSSLVSVIKYLETQDFDSELIVVDDGSSDNTIEIVKEVFASSKNEIPTQAIRYERNQGKGYAVRTGLRAASGGIALFCDADLSTPISQMEKLVAPIRSDQADVTFGSRALDRNLIGTHQPWRREQGGKIFNFLVRALTSLPFWDTQCGFKAFRTKTFRPILEAAQINRFGFDVELLFVAHRFGLRLEEIPVSWNHCEGSKVNVLRDSWQMISEVRQVRRNMKRGVYDAASEQINLLKQQDPQFSLTSSANAPHKRERAKTAAS